MCNNYMKFPIVLGLLTTVNAKYLSGYDMSLRTTKCMFDFNENIYNEIVPDNIDWRDHNVVTPVKNQGNCGSCWSFSATGAIESVYAQKTGTLRNISEQQLIDCSLIYGNMGCNGGVMENAFEYATDNYMCSEEDVPYEGVRDKSINECRRCQTAGLIKLNGCVDIPTKNQTALKLAVAKQPVSVAIQADTEIFQTYTNGVIVSDKCGTNVDHGVLVVGYGKENDVPYWLIKNSWGSEWGDGGFVKILRDESDMTAGTCGIASKPSYPVYF